MFGELADAWAEPMEKARRKVDRARAERQGQIDMFGGQGHLGTSGHGPGRHAHGKSAARAAGGWHPAPHSKKGLLRRKKASGGYEYKDPHRARQGGSGGDGADEKRPQSSDSFISQDERRKATSMLREALKEVDEVLDNNIAGRGHFDMHGIRRAANTIRRAADGERVYRRRFETAMGTLNRAMRDVGVAHSRHAERTQDMWNSNSITHTMEKERIVGETMPQEAKAVLRDTGMNEWTVRAGTSDADLQAAHDALAGAVHEHKVEKQQASREAQRHEHAGIAKSLDSLRQQVFRELDARRRQEGKAASGQAETVPEHVSGLSQLGDEAKTFMATEKLYAVERGRLEDAIPDKATLNMLTKHGTKSDVAVHTKRLRDALDKAKAKVARRKGGGPGRSTEEDDPDTHITQTKESMASLKGELGERNTRSRKMAESLRENHGWTREETEAAHAAIRRSGRPADELPGVGIAAVAQHRSQKPGRTPMEPNLHPGRVEASVNVLRDQFPGRRGDIDDFARGAQQYKIAVDDDAKVAGDHAGAARHYTEAFQRYAQIMDAARRDGVRGMNATRAFRLAVGIDDRKLPPAVTRTPEPQPRPLGDAEQERSDQESARREARVKAGQEKRGASDGGRAVLARKMATDRLHRRLEDERADLQRMNRKSRRIHAAHWDPHEDNVHTVARKKDAHEHAVPVTVRATDSDADLRKKAERAIEGSNAAREQAEASRAAELQRLRDERREANRSSTFRDYGGVRKGGTNFRSLAALF